MIKKNRLESGIKTERGGAVPSLAAWWHCGSQLQQTSAAQVFAVFSLSAPLSLSPVVLKEVWVLSLTD